MPEIPEELFVESIKKLVDIDSAWVPENEGQSLYLRPFMVASEAHLGLRAANEYLFMVIASPVAPFFLRKAMFLLFPYTQRLNM